jgi:nicotinate-nucleotide pyrophosphorylase (carboxylating)
VPTATERAADGQAVARGDVVAELTGRTQVLLVAERTGLNVVSRLSGIATHTRRWAQALEGTGAQVLDTRPLLAGDPAVPIIGSGPAAVLRRGQRATPATSR